MPMTIYPYLIGPVWVFDDERTGLKEEAFVCGMSEMISRMIDAKNIPNASKGFAMTFGDESFDGVDAELNWLRADEPNSVMGGNWYSGIIAGQEMQGWLCPALFCFFPQHHSDYLSEPIHFHRASIPSGMFRQTIHVNRGSSDRGTL